jgi:hypothetical protein
MLEKLRQVLVESFVGAIGLGLMLSEAFGYFATGIVIPLQNWINRSEFRGFVNRPPTSFPLIEGVPHLLRCVVLLIIWYALLRWLYFKPLEEIPEHESGTAGLNSTNNRE